MRKIKNRRFSEGKKQDKSLILWLLNQYSIIVKLMQKNKLIKKSGKFIF